MRLFFVAAALIELAGAALGESEVVVKDFRWTDISPSESLVFHDCFEKYQCARFDVPMDWNRTDGQGSRVTVAVMKLPAKVPVTDERYGGAILLNPGGPGGSGVKFLMVEGEKIQNIADASVDPPTMMKSEDKYFDIVSWDPRGVNNTTPHFICFPDFAAREAWARGVVAEGLMTSSNTAYATKWSRFQAVGDSCAKVMASLSDNEDNLLEHINTPPVVGDMVAMIEALGKWREAEALKFLASPLCHDRNEVPMDSFHEVSDIQSILKGNGNCWAHEDEILKRTKWRKGEEKLQYWGFSYGTAIGATFAALYPDRIGKVVLDGVVDMEDYTAGRFSTNIVDNDAVFGKFFHYCALAGPSKCAFSESESEIAQDLYDKFIRVFRTLHEQPIAVPSSLDSSSPSPPEIVTSSDLIRYVHDTLYTPVKKWPALASLLRDLRQGNGTSLSIAKNKVFDVERPRGPCTEPYSPQCQGPAFGEEIEVSTSVWCGDGDPTNTTLNKFKNTTLAMLLNQSPLFGGLWAEFKMECAHWKPRPKWRNTAPFKDIETSHPLLFIGTTQDHVCPMMNARKMATVFPGAVALEQASQGHCSISSPSLCTARYLRSYFQIGKLPKEGTVCQVDQLPFDGVKTAEQLGLSDEGAKLWNFIRSIHE